MSKRIRRATTVRLLSGLVAAIVALPVQAAPVMARTARPVRSGTILGAYAADMRPVGCSLVADCAAWLATQCDPLLAGQDPALFTSIVDVSDLAGSDRRLVRQEPNRSLANTAQFWSGNCRLMGRVTSVGGYMSIPQGARWLTITASVVPNTHWELW